MPSKSGKRRGSLIPPHVMNVRSLTEGLHQSTSPVPSRRPGYLDHLASTSSAPPPPPPQVQQTDGSSTGPQSHPKAVCTQWQRTGSCRFGARCLFHHVSLQTRGERGEVNRPAMMLYPGDIHYHMALAAGFPFPPAMHCPSASVEPLPRRYPPPSGPPPLPHEYLRRRTGEYATPTAYQQVPDIVRASGSGYPTDEQQEQQQPTTTGSVTPPGRSTLELLSPPRTVVTAKGQRRCHHHHSAQSHTATDAFRELNVNLPEG